MVAASLTLLMICAGPTPSDVVKNIPYGPHPGQVFDWYKPIGTAGSSGPSPVLIFQHGAHGGGNKGHLTQKSPSKSLLPLLINNGITVMAIDNQAFPENVYPTQVDDAALAIQFFRGNAADYDIDPNRIAIWGWSSGSTIASILCYGVDFADPQGTAITQQSSRPMAFLNWKGVTNWTLIVPWYPGIMFDKPTLSAVDPLLLKEASGAEAVACIPRPTTPPVLSYYGFNETPPPLVDVHDLTLAKDLHAKISAFPAAAASSVIHQTATWPEVGPQDLVEQVVWLRERFGMAGIVDVGLSLEGTLGAPTLQASGSFAAGAGYAFQMQAAIPSSIAVLVYAGPPIFAELLGGTLVPTPLIAVPVVTGPSGALSLGGTMPVGQLPAAISVQFWHADPGGEQGYAASNGLHIPIGG